MNRSLLYCFLDNYSEIASESRRPVRFEQKYRASNTTI